MKKHPKILSLCLVVLLMFQSLPVTQASLNTPSLVASAGIVMEASTGRVLFEKNADAMYQPGSMTKVMTAYIIFEEIYKGNLSFDTQITITSSQAALSTNRSYPANVTLIAGRQISVDMLLKLIFLPSASAACVVAAEHISGSQSAFVQRMNETADRLSVDANYKNVHGVGTHYLSARGQATLVQQFIQRFPKVLDYTSLRSVTYNGYTHYNTNHLLSGSYFPYEGADGFKTGTIGSNYNLCSTAVRDGIRLVAVVMQSNGNTNRHLDSAKLLDYGFAEMNSSFRYYYDMWVYPEAEKYYVGFRRSNMIVLSKNGWASPGRDTTKGEFAVLLIGALEAYGAKESPSTQPYAAQNPQDVGAYYGGELIQRGVAYGILTLDGNGNFNPNSALTQDFVTTTLNKTASVLGISSKTAGAIYEEGAIPEEIIVETLGSGIDGLSDRQKEEIQAVLPGLPLPTPFKRFVSALLTEEEAPVLPTPPTAPEVSTPPSVPDYVVPDVSTPPSVPEYTTPEVTTPEPEAPSTVPSVGNVNQLTRGEAVYQIGVFLENNGYY